MKHWENLGIKLQKHLVNILQILHQVLYHHHHPHCPALVM